VAESLQREPFDLVNGPLLRCHLVRLHGGTTAITIALHHVSGDSESIRRLLDEVAAAYHDRPLPPLTTDVPGFVEWLASRREDEDRAYWLAAAEAPAPGRLAFATPVPPEPDGFVRRRASVDPAGLAAGGGASGFAVTLAGLAAVLARSSTSRRVALGLIPSLRVHPAALPLVGYLLNTVPLELDVDEDATVREAAAAASQAIGIALAHRGRPLAAIVADRREAGLRLPDLSVMLTYHEVPTCRFGPYLVEHEATFNGTSVADATFFVEVRDDAVDLGIEYRGSVMTGSDARRLLADLDAALVALVSAPDRRVGELTLPGDGASRLVTAPPARPEQSVMAAIEHHLAVGGARPAVRCGAESLNWAELAARSEQLARALLDAGVGAGDRVLVCLARSVDLVAAVVAVLRLGAAYVPVDPTYPPGRIRRMVEGAGARASISADRDLGLTGNDVVIAGMDLGPDSAALGPLPAVAPAAGAEAYVIFTSGSTGVPRGVPVTHASLDASTAARAPVYGGLPERFLLLSSIAFDSSVAGLFWTLATGGELVLPTDAQAHDPAAIARLVEEAAVTHTLLVPSLYEALLRHDGIGGWPAVVIVAGEACSAALVERHHARHPHSELWNEYGPTEATVWASVHRCRPGEDPVPIGRPIPGAWLAVMAHDDRVCPDGVTGELVVGGPGVVGGYLDDPTQTATRFGSTASGERFFRTGDLAVVRSGVVHFLGRLDRQLNLGGLRFEPDEIERALAADPAISAVVVCTEDPRPLEELLAAVPPAHQAELLATAAGAADPAAALATALRSAVPAIPRVVAHVELASGERLEVARLRALAAEQLPAVARPAVYVAHEHLPRSPNGKLDRDAAERLPVTAATEHPATAERGALVHHPATARTIATEFAAVLRRHEVPLEGSFFDLGGHSLLAVELSRRLEARLGVAVEVSTIYQAPTPAALATRLGTTAVKPLEAAGQEHLLIPVQTAGTAPPLFGVHVLGQNAAFYRPLSQRLGTDVPVWGLGLIDSRDLDESPTEVAALTVRYADSVEAVAPTGPVSLAAVSLGSAVAIELARELRRRGRAIHALVVFDATGPDADRFAPSTRERVATHWQAARTDPATYIAERVASVRWAVGFHGPRLERVVRQALGRPLPHRVVWQDFIEANIQAAAGVDLEPFETPLTVMKASADRYNDHLVRNDMGWGRVALGGVRVVMVAGGHISMLAEPHVASVAAAMRPLLVRAAAVASDG
jgi:amino acid adenylation domain-containing protein